MSDPVTMAKFDIYETKYNFISKPATLRGQLHSAGQSTFQSANADSRV